MDSKTEKKEMITTQKLGSTPKDSVNIKDKSNNVIDQDIEDLCDENLTTLNKIHAILLNCSNLSKKQKVEFAESERYFMKLYLNKLLKK